MDSRLECNYLYNLICKKDLASFDAFKPCIMPRCF